MVQKMTLLVSNWITPAQPLELRRENFRQSSNSGPGRRQNVSPSPTSPPIPVTAIPFPHVADIASIREGSEQQACCCYLWPSMASSSRAPCWARGKSECF